MRDLIGYESQTMMSDKYLYSDHLCCLSIVSLQSVVFISKAAF